MANKKISQESAAVALTGDELIRASQNGLNVYLTAAQLATYVGAQSSSVFVNLQTGTNYSVVTGDRSKLVSFTNVSSIAVTLPQAGTLFPNGWFCFFQNTGAGAVTITPTTSMVDGASDVSLSTDEGCLVVSDGSNYYTMRGLN